MIPTRTQIKADFLGLLDDPNGASFTDSVFQLAFRSAFDALFQAFLNHQCPRIMTIAPYTLPANTASLSPVTMGDVNFGDIDELEERLSGSTEKYTRVAQVDKLTQRDASDRLLEFVWRLDTMYFIGATTARDLRITSESSGQAPVDDGTSVGVDGSLSFLSNFAVGKAGRRKGYDEIAAECMNFAVGPRYAEGRIGGELWRLVSAKVRAMQHVQVQQRRYSATTYLPRRRVPYIMAQAQGGSGTASIQFSSYEGTVSGVIDGANAVFTLPGLFSAIVVYLNGSALTQSQHYTFTGSNTITFASSFIPQLGADILVEAWA